MFTTPQVLQVTFSVNVSVQMLVIQILRLTPVAVVRYTLN